jgi:uncharacterized protein YcbK (DUF882 family)
LHRRNFLKSLAGFALAVAASGSVEAFAKESASSHTLRLYNTHTNEHLAVTCMEDGRVIESAAKKIDNFLRCHYNGKTCKIDRDLIKLMCRIDKKFGSSNTLQIISGYRSPEYNAVLARRSSGVAKKSLHLKGMALDFKIPGVSMKKLYSEVRSLQSGGAGVYRDFVHMDTGRVRFWGKSA